MTRPAMNPDTAPSASHIGSGMNLALQRSISMPKIAITHSTYTVLLCSILHALSEWLTKPGHSAQNEVLSTQRRCFACFTPKCSIEIVPHRREGSYEKEPAAPAQP